MFLSCFGISLKQSVNKCFEKNNLLNNRDFNIMQNNRDNDFFLDQAGLVQDYKFKDVLILINVEPSQYCSLTLKTKQKKTPMFR